MTDRLISADALKATLNIPDEQNSAIVTVMPNESAKSIIDKTIKVMLELTENAIDKQPTAYYVANTQTEIMLLNLAVVLLGDIGEKK